MKLPESQLVRDVASYWGISTLGAFKSIINRMDANTKLVYYANGVIKFTRVRHLKRELR